MASDPTDCDLLVLRVVARYRAWADGKLVDVDDDNDEFPRFSVEEDRGKLSEPAGAVAGNRFDPPKSPPRNL